MPIQSASRANLFLSNAHFRRITDKFLAVIEELRTRSTFRRTLGNISDQQLRDAGLIRSDLDAACGHGLSHSAGSELKAAARSRAGNW